jgi:hypothetical protein
MKRRLSKPRPRVAARRRPAAKKKRRTDSRPPRLGAVDAAEIESLRAQLAHAASSARPPRWNADPDDVRRSVAKLVLTLVDFVRQLLERQAIRRVDAGTLTDEETEAVGLALMRLEETVRDLCAQFDLKPEDLNLALGPVGKLV